MYVSVAVIEFLPFDLLNDVRLPIPRFIFAKGNLEAWKLRIRISHVKGDEKKTKTKNRKTEKGNIK